MWKRRQDGKARDDRKNRDPTVSDQKKGRSESVANNKPLKPRRNESNRTVPSRSEIEKRASDQKSDSDLTKKQALTAPLTQKYAGMKHPDLPIRSTLDPGTPAEQHKKWLSDDPKRFHKIQKEIDEWIEQLNDLKGKTGGVKELWRKGKGDINLVERLPDRDGSDQCQRRTSCLKNPGSLSTIYAILPPP